MVSSLASHVIVFILLSVELVFGDGKCLFAEWKIVGLGIGENPPVLTSTGHCVSNDGVAWVFGGMQYSKVNHRSGISDQLWSYDTQTHGWRMHQKRSGPDQWPLPRHNAKLCCGLDHLVLYGGTVSSDVSLNDMWIFDRTNGIWSYVNLSTAMNTEHIQLLNSGLVTSWCWNDSLWYIHNPQKPDGTHGKVTHFAPTEMQWVTQSFLLEVNRTSGSGWGEANPIVFGLSVWLFPNIGSAYPSGQDEVQAHSFSMESFNWELHSFNVESQCPKSLENDTDISDPSDHQSSIMYENSTIILGRKNYLSQVWSVDIFAKKLWLSNSCNNVLAYGTPVNSCVLENSSRWFYDDVWYSHGGVLLCKHNGEFFLDQLWSVEPNMMTVCNDMDALSPGVIFMLIFFSLSSMAIIILCSIVLRKCVNGPYLKPPVHYGKAIRYSQLALEEIT